ncbi:MAG: biotin/lipoate--protein ligase family protein [Aurantimonas endophytica]|uniref:biotin/lipoate--protein ligase family protein n=1 Tax=Aurantimonas endophytica TaxID=1522175 RepID=UPI0030014F8B
MSLSHNAALSLPPPFHLVTLREAGDAYAHAQSIAAADGAGTLVWARRFHMTEFAVVLEPEEPLASARRVVYAAGNALADALAIHAPPQQPIGFDWPGGLRVDGALVGGLRLAWPTGAAEDAVPDWLVLGCSVRMIVMRAGEPGFRPLLGGLDEQGFEELDPAALIEGFSRYFLREINEWNAEGFGAVQTRWLLRAEDDVVALPDDKLLAEALRVPGWLDPATGAPWL